MGRAGARDGLERLAGFDKLAGVYWWLERMTLGRMLERCREHFLMEMGEARRALVLGDGDGRFAAALLRANGRVSVAAVDGSAGMLRALEDRVAKMGAAGRLWVLRADARERLPEGKFDLVCTHFFLDCLDEAGVRAVAAGVRARMEPGAMWVVSEFAVPENRMRWPAALLVRGLYAVFGVLTGLRARRLPDYATMLRRAGFTAVAGRAWLGGVLRAEVWRWEPAAGEGD